MWYSLAGVMIVRAVIDSLLAVLIQIVERFADAGKQG